MKRWAWLFPGQGSQAVGMGGYLCESFSVARAAFAEADEALGEDLSGLIQSGPEEVLKQTQNAQPAILTVSVAAGRVLMDAGIEPAVAAGHSLGEYSALVLSGAMTFSDAVRLVRLRGKYMQEAVPIGDGAMAAVLGADDGLVEQVCSEVSRPDAVVEPANYNCPGQLVISGAVAAVAKATEELNKAGVKKIVALKVSAPFHCSLLRRAAERLSADLREIRFSDPRFPYIANVDAKVVTTAGEIADRLVNQVYKPVLWSQSLSRIVSGFSPECAAEVGAGQVASGHMKKVAPQLQRFHTDNLDGLNDILTKS